MTERRKTSKTQSYTYFSIPKTCLDLQIYSKWHLHIVIKLTKTNCRVPKWLADKKSKCEYRKTKQSIWKKMLETCICTPEYPAVKMRYPGLVWLVFETTFWLTKIEEKVSSVDTYSPFQDMSVIWKSFCLPKGFQKRRESGFIYLKNFALLRMRYYIVSLIKNLMEWLTENN